MGGAVPTHKTFRVFRPDKPSPPWGAGGVLPVTLWQACVCASGGLHSVTEKGRAGPRLLLSSPNDRLLLDTRLADGISKGFQEPSGVGTIIANHASNKARRVISWQKRSKTNSIVFLRDSILKKKIARLTNRFSAAYNSAFCSSS